MVPTMSWWFPKLWYLVGVLKRGNPAIWGSVGVPYFRKPDISWGFLEEGR